MISKAVIPVAGWGTRRLPITKAIEKCMLPIGDRPLVDFVVQDCIAAGITDIYFVVSEDSTQLQTYYGRNLPLEAYLKANKKEAQLAQIMPPEGVSFTYITQSAQDKYGTAIPVSLAMPYIEEGESIVVVTGDDFIYNADGSSEIKRLIEATPEGGCGLLGVEVPLGSVGMYGVIEIVNDDEYRRIVERPRPEEAPSNLINVSKYVLNYAVLHEIMTYAQAEVEGEYYIIEPINRYVERGGTVKVVRPKGQYLDGGNTSGWLHANQVVLGSGR